MPRSLEEWQEEIAAEMLEDLEELSGIDIGEMLADAVEGEIAAEESAQFREFEIYEEPTEDQPLDLENPDGIDTDEYFDVLFEDIDVDQDAEIDKYAED